MNIFEDKITLGLGNTLLRPITADDIPALKEIAIDPDIWKFTPSKISNEKEVIDFVEQSLSLRNKNERITFIIIDKKNNNVMEVA